MKVIALSDIHYPAANLEALVAKVAVRDPDVLLFCGDIAVGDEMLHRALAPFSPLRAVKAAIAGNHDLWSADSQQRYEETLPRLYHEHGFHFLDSDGPLPLGDGIAVVGNIGWHDYSFRMKTGDIGALLRVAGSRIVSRWEELRDADYAAKHAYIHREGGKVGEVTWNDGYYIRWRFSDAEFLERGLAKLQQDLHAASQQAERIIVATHHVPFDDFVVRRPENPGYTFCDAYMGSERLGQMIASFPKVRLALHGHTHTLLSKEAGDIACHNVYSKHGELFETEL